MIQGTVGDLEKEFKKPEAVVWLCFLNVVRQEQEEESMEENTKKQQQLLVGFFLHTFVQAITETYPNTQLVHDATIAIKRSALSVR